MDYINPSHQGRPDNLQNIMVLLRILELKVFASITDTKLGNTSSFVDMYRDTVGLLNLNDDSPANHFEHLMYTGRLQLFEYSALSQDLKDKSKMNTAAEAMKGKMEALFATLTGIYMNNANTRIRRYYQSAYRRYSIRMGLRKSYLLYYCIHILDPTMLNFLPSYFRRQIQTTIDKSTGYTKANFRLDKPHVQLKHTLLRILQH